MASDRTQTTTEHLGTPAERGPITQPRTDYPPFALGAFDGTGGDPLEPERYVAHHTD